MSNAIKTPILAGVFFLSLNYVMMKLVCNRLDNFIMMKYNSLKVNLIMMKLEE